jgi:hypothetical protein
MPSKASTTRKATASRKAAAAPKRTTARKATTAKRTVTVPNAASKALARSLGKAWAVTGSTMANKVQLRYNGRTVVWLVQGANGNRASRRAIGLRPCPATAAVAKQALAKLQRSVWA